MGKNNLWTKKEQGTNLNVSGPNKAGLAFQKADCPEA